MPLKFWDEAFLTATFLINLLPTKVLNLASPAKTLLHALLIMSPYTLLVVQVGLISAPTTNISWLFIPKSVSS
jgi:hypothetical protein